MNQHDPRFRTAAETKRPVTKKNVPIWMHVLGVSGGGICALIFGLIILWATGTFSSKNSVADKQSNRDRSSRQNPLSDGQLPDSKVSVKNNQPKTESTQAKNNQVGKTNRPTKIDPGLTKTRPNQEPRTGVDTPETPAIDSSLPSIYEAASRIQFDVDPWIRETSFRESPAVFQVSIELESPAVAAKDPTDSQSTNPVDQPAAEKVAVPADEDQKKILARVKNVFASSFKSRAANDVRDRAKLFLETGLESKNHAEKFVLIEHALNDSLSIGDADMALSAYQALDKSFLINQREYQVEIYKQLATKSLDLDAAKKLINAGNAFCATAVEDDDYANAIKLNERIQVLARKNKLAHWTDPLKAESKRIKSLSRKYRALAESLEVLARSNNDPAANAKVGEFYCIDKGDFQRGLPFLSKATNHAASKIALDELNAPKDGRSRISIADRWWEYSDDPSVRSHAASIYQSAVENTSGLERKRIEQRLNDAKAASLANSPHKFHLIYEKNWTVRWKNGHPTWSKAVFHQDGKFDLVALKRNYKNTFVIEGDILILDRKGGKYFIVVATDGQRLDCRKIDFATGKLLDQGVGVLSNGK